MQKDDLVGKVKDIAFTVGKTGICLTVENETGETQNISMGRCSSSIRLRNSKTSSRKCLSQHAETILTSSLSGTEKISKSYEPQQQPIRRVLLVRKQKKLLGHIKQSSNNPFKLKFRKNPLNRFAQRAIKLSRGFLNTNDGTATPTKNTFQ